MALPCRVAQKIERGRLVGGQDFGKFFKRQNGNSYVENL